MTTDPSLLSSSSSSSSIPSTTTVAGLFVAGLGAAYVCVRLSRVLGTPPGHTHTQSHPYSHPRSDAHASADGDHAKNEAANATTRRGKGKKKKKKGVRGVGEDVGAGEGEGNGNGEGVVAVPGDFEGAGANTEAGSFIFSAGTTTASKQVNDGTLKTNKKKKKKQAKANDEDEGGGEDKSRGKEGGLETGKDSEVGAGVGSRRAATYGRGPRSDDSTDASVSLSPSVSTSALGSSQTMGKGSLRASTGLVPSSWPHTHAHAPSQPRPREIRPSLSFDTDSSWTHVDHHRLEMSGSIDRQDARLVDATDVTSSDMASTASDSPVTERTDRVSTDTRGTRADLMQRTLAEKFAPRPPSKTGVDDMLEEPDFPTIARVVRVQPRADETLVPGFSWEDYGDVVEESLLVHDADQEDEGEWDVVKSRNPTRPPQTTSTSTSYAPPAQVTTTKKQRQNARKRELAKSAKVEAEAARLQGLAKHKRELERLRIIEQSRQGGGKRPSGGMQASVDDRGKLIWE